MADNNEHQTTSRSFAITKLKRRSSTIWVKAVSGSVERPGLLPHNPQGVFSGAQPGKARMSQVIHQAPTP
jgi:hypothetical protein